jgi:prepilin-type N-terminal cleavage/methylation domain-containing protein
LLPPTNVGFSLIELMLVVVILSILCGVVFSQIGQMQQRAVVEQNKVDQFQQARDFLDQIFRDARLVGYPNVRNFDTTVAPTPAWQSPLINDSRLAVGLVKVSGNQLAFEGDVNGDGNVYEVSYLINGSGSCANCLQRAQVTKTSGTDPLTQITNLTGTTHYSVEVQNVYNTSSIFTAYDASGNSITLPIDIDSNASTVATVKVIQVSLQVANTGTIDPQTRQTLEADIAGRVQILNCSMAATGGSNTCQ